MTDLPICNITFRPQHWLHLNHPRFASVAAIQTHFLVIDLHLQISKLYSYPSPYPDTPQLNRFTSIQLRLALNHYPDCHHSPLMPSVPSCESISHQKFQLIWDKSASTNLVLQRTINSATHTKLFLQTTISEKLIISQLFSSETWNRWC